MAWPGYPAPFTADQLGGGSAQTEAQQKANGAFCAGQHMGGQPTFVPPPTLPGPPTYALYRANNTTCPVKNPGDP